jgi:hypothetical protein
MASACWRNTRVGKEKASVSDTEENEVLVRRLFDAQTTGDLAALEETMTLDFVAHGGFDQERSRGARGMPLGFMPGMLYEQKEIVLDASEATFFYSDGLVEAPRP